MKLGSHQIITSIFIVCLIVACGEPSGSSETNTDIYTEEGDLNNQASLLEVNNTLPIIKLDTLIKANLSVYIRSGAGITYKSVGKLDKDDMVLFCGLTGNWYKTIYKNKTAYISTIYTSLVTFEKDNEITENIIDVGYTQLGFPYVWGSERYHWGNGILNTNFVEGEFDCSALMQYIFYIGANINLGLTTREQVLQGTEIAKEDIQRGDLLFFTNSSRYYNTGIQRVGHVALYLGDNYILQTASDHAVIEPISTLRWSYYITARRFT